jgi:hypothetical protein
VTAASVVVIVGRRSPAGQATCAATTMATAAQTAAIKMKVTPKS